MAEGKYRFNLYIAGFGDDRKAEVIEALKHLHPKSGKDWFKKVLDGARETGRSEVVYQTNSKNDAYRTAQLLHHRGAALELEDLFPEQDEDDL